MDLNVLGLTRGLEPLSGDHMNRFSETETVLLGRLRALKATPLKSISLLDVSASMQEDGFATHEIDAVLVALKQDKVIAHVPGDRLVILKDLPDCP